MEKAFHIINTTNTDWNTKGILSSTADLDLGFCHAKKGVFIVGTGAMISQMEEENCSSMRSQKFNHLRVNLRRGK